MEIMVKFQNNLNDKTQIRLCRKSSEHPILSLARLNKRSQDICEISIGRFVRF